MSPVIQSDRWSVGPDDFAVRVIVPDLKGFFDGLPVIRSFPKSRTLIIEPGTKSLVIDDELLVGQFDAGTYTLETFLERLQFWRDKQVTIILARCEDVPIESKATKVPCADSVCFDVNYRWTIQIADILLFMKNLMGARDRLAASELTRLIAPLVAQAVYATIGSSDYEQVRRPDFGSQLLQGTKSQLDVKLSRYGITFTDLQNVSLRSDADHLADKQGKLFERGREQQIAKAASELENEELIGRAADYHKRVALRDELRRVVSEDKLNAISSANDFEKAILQIDKDKLLRAEERESLLAAFTERKEDREGRRAHLLATLDVQREKEIEELRMQMDHVMQHKSLAQEIELAKLSRGEEAEKWRQELLQESEELTHRLAQKQTAMDAKWRGLREKRQQMRADEWDAILHERRMEDIRADVELRKANRARQITILQTELDARLAADKLELEKRQQEWELEHRNRRSESQLTRLQKLQEMNAQFAERQQRMQMEMETLKADGESKRELNRIQAMGGLSTEALIALTDAQNATTLADLKKTEAQVSTQANAELNAERLRLYEKLNETERAKADAIADAFKLAMQAQQSSAHQMVGGLAQSASASSNAQIPTPMLSSPMATPPMLAAVTWYISLAGQQSPPLQWAQILQCIQTGQVNASTMVWKAGMSSWMPAGQVPELVPYLRNNGGGPPPMQVSAGPSGTSQG